METRVKLPRSCRIILKMMNHHELLTAQAIYSRMRSANPKAPGLSTTYRSLEILVREGHVQVIDLGDGEKLYEVVNQGEHHHHLICNVCGTSVHMDECAIEDFRNILVDNYGFQVAVHRMEIFGTCEQCLKKR